MIWVPLQPSNNGTTVEVSDQESDHPGRLATWTRITYSDKDANGYTGEVQEWWIDCSNAEGFVVTKRLSRDLIIDIDTFALLIDLNIPLAEKRVVETCSLFGQ
jgi:hypothetical protein